MKRTTQRTAIIITTILSFVVVMQLACAKFSEFENPDSEWLSGGIQTVYDEGSASFSHAFPSMPDNLKKVHEIGDIQFEQTFVSAPAPKNPGLGPIFNNVSCSSCHIADGRGKVPESIDKATNMLFRISIPGIAVNGGPNPVPNFGDQIQNRGILGTVKEADVEITFTEKTFSFSDGTKYSLRFPSYKIINTYTPLPANVLLSPRIAAPVFGLGLLEAISDADILARADENDSDGDGISGKPNQVYDVLQKKLVLGKFGWKANQPNLLQQTAAAYNGDIGITTSLFPMESSAGQLRHAFLPGGSYELKDSLLHSVEFYIRTLAVPVRRLSDNPVVLKGKKLFLEIGCASCHIPDQRTAVNVTFAPVSNQLIHPYTDLLLHDMGNDLADNRPDFNAKGNEWRTPPLWGIGLTQKVNGHNNFLHDGRARSLLEAVMWHGGEAETAKNKVKSLPKADRDALIKFLESL